MANSDINGEILDTINILEGLETLMDQAPNEAISKILQKAWLRVSETFPEDFQAATKEDAGAEGLRCYLRVKAFFENPSENPIAATELEQYYRNHLPIDSDTADFLFPE